MIKYDLGWGNSVCVREAFLEVDFSAPVSFSSKDLMKFDYPVHEGDPELVEMTKAIVKRQTGNEYKYIILTNGATGGVVISLRMFKTLGFDNVITRNPPYYVRYPGMMRSTGLKHATEDQYINEYRSKFIHEKNAILLDLPSNPQGLTTSVDPLDVIDTTVIDGVYFNRVYMPDLKVIRAIPKHDIMIGSYSKLTGVNGLRVGWIATNNENYCNYIKELVTSEYCGLSTSTSIILKQKLKDLDWPAFERRARLKLDNNRTEWQKLEKYFGDVIVEDVGMFYYGPMDKHCKALFEKAGVKWTNGAAMGTNDDFGRFNLGQDNKMISEVVKAIIKTDTIKS